MEEDFTEEELKKKLEAFPSSFTILPKHIGLVELQTKVQILINKLTSDQCSTSKSKTENLKINNFLSYLHFILGNYQEAEDYCDESLSSDPDNIIALSNKAQFLLETGRSPSEVEKYVIALEKLKTSGKFAIQKCFAEAEIAYCYGRMGPFNHQKAADQYRKVIKECPLTDYSWKFGLALALIRQTHMFISRADDKYNPDAKLQEALDLLSEVVMNTERTDRVLCSLAWVKLGQTLSAFSKFKPQLKLQSKISKLQEREMFDKAFTIAPKEPFVLENYGRHLRYCNELKKSESLLREAIAIKPTCFAYHHLALVLKRRVEMSASHIPVTRERSQRYHQSPLSKMVKCPSQVKRFPGNQLLLDAIQLLRKALNIDSTALWMYYEIGLIYRMLDDTENAINTLTQIIAKRHILATPELLINVYEQLGLCYLEMSRNDGNTQEKQTRLKRDGKVRLQNAVELQAKIVQKDPEFRNVWTSFPTLKELLEGSPKSPKLSKELAKLHKLMGHDEEAIHFYKKAADQGDLKGSDYRNWLESCLKQQEFDKATKLLGMLECTSVFWEIPKQLCINVYSEGGFHAYSSADLALAYQRFQNAFSISCAEGKPGILSKTSTEDAFDIHILHSCDKSKCYIPNKLSELIQKYTGLRCTVNDDDCILGSFKLQALIEIMEDCSCIIILTHDSNKCDQYHVEHALQISKSPGGGKLLTLSDIPENVPVVARTKPFLNYPSSMSQVVPEGETIPQEHKSWLKEFLSKML